MKQRLAKWGGRLLAVVLIAVLMPVLGIAASLRVAYTGTPSPQTGSTGRDALWMGHAWVDGRRDAHDVQRLARRLRRTGVRDVYVHVGPLADDGSLDPALHPRSQWLLMQLTRAAPELRVSAWLGNVVGRDGVDLDQAATQRHILAGARTMLREGFDGIHYDFEPVPSGHAGYLRLLERTANLTREPGQVLSVAAEPVAPLPGAAAAARWLARHPLYWSRGYLYEVAERSDQVAIMTYDSGMPLESLYGGYVKRQVDIALRTVPQSTTLLAGAPAYHTGRPFYRSSAETVTAAARGTRLALSEHPGRRTRIGLALYVDFAATKQDWRAYRREWLIP